MNANYRQAIASLELAVVGTSLAIGYAPPKTKAGPNGLSRPQRVPGVMQRQLAPSEARQSQQPHAAVRQAKRGGLQLRVSTLGGQNSTPWWITFGGCANNGHLLRELNLRALHSQKAQLKIQAIRQNVMGIGSPSNSQA